MDFPGVLYLMEAKRVGISHVVERAGIQSLYRPGFQASLLQRPCDL